ncbi:MAG: hypothetical protein J07HQW2_02537 [Haloquadratum walsbyi J07HQW2]|uniref:TAT (Twin-arginine translocation) pathway signal sequence n=1 Tax=Haloquadratum walsbyi J07HQW2 TaxID=1238425 RepID=U1NG35_9EURY|nr:MAG: hypothetical protein J07HQW2_02537 [Haloquadratum walsbyi J07HQW2]
MAHQSQTQANRRKFLSACGIVGIGLAGCTQSHEESRNRKEFTKEYHS